MIAMIVRHPSVVLLGAVGVVLGSCGSVERGVEAPVEAPSAVSTTADDGPSPTEVAEPAPSPLEQLEATSTLGLGLTALPHFAEARSGGSMTIDLGKPSSRKYIGGGWRTGWRTDRKVDGQTDYYEANTKVVRVFFDHDKGGFDRVVVRMKAVKTSNKVAFYVNGESVGRAKLTGDWEEFPIDVPASATRDGQNQLMMRFSWDIRHDGRAQAAHIDKIAVVGDAGLQLDDVVGAVATTNLEIGGKQRRVVAVDRPQTVTWPVSVPAHEPRLGLALGGTAKNARVTITATSDGGATKELLVAPLESGRWLEKVVNLEGYEGEVVALSYKVTGEFANGGTVGLHAGLYQKKVSPPASGKRVDHVLVYLIDTLRYDKLGAYNDKSSVPTPNLDAFAADAAVFDAAYDTENWTKPSTASILTGLYPWTHKAKEGNSKLSQRVLMVSEHLQNEQIKTGSFIANGYVSDAFGFDQGWHRYTNYIREGKVTDAGRLVDDALKFIDDSEKKGKRWFTYVHTIDPHVPYSAPGPWKMKHWRGGKYRGFIKPQATGNQLADIKGKKKKVTDRDKAYLEALYDGEVAYNDAEFGRLVAGLKERGVYDNTLIIVLADHGEEFWDHGSVGHGHSLYDEMVRTPFFVRFPGHFEPGTRVALPVSTADVVPTMLEALGVEPIKDVEGVSLLELADGVGTPRPRVATSDFLFRKKAVRVGNYHWLTNGQSGELYNLARDPRSKKNLKRSHPVAMRYVRENFGMFMGAGDKTSWWEPLPDVNRARPEHDSDVATVDPELQDQLEAMGYVEGATGEVSAEEDRRLMEKEDN